MTYLLDANTLKEAKNRYYQMSICPGYWDWLRKANQTGEVVSIRSVRDELKRGNDALAEWATNHASLFLDESDQATQTAFAQVASMPVRPCRSAAICAKPSDAPSRMNTCAGSVRLSMRLW